MPVNLAAPDVAALVQRLLNMANDLARRGSDEMKTIWKLIRAGRNAECGTVRITE